MCSVILMCGVSGSGKTRYSKMLEEDKGYTRLSLDEYIWSIYGDNFPSLPGNKKKVVFMDAFREIESQLLQLISQGKNVVLDSTMCKKAKRDRTVMLCRAQGVEPQIIYLSASKELLRERLAQRKGKGPNDQIVPDEDLEAFLTNFEVPAPEEKALTIENQ